MDYSQTSPGTGLMVTSAGTATIVDNSSKLKCKYICGGESMMSLIPLKSDNLWWLEESFFGEIKNYRMTNTSCLLFRYCRYYVKRIIRYIAHSTSIKIIPRDSYASFHFTHQPLFSSLSFP